MDKSILLIGCGKWGKHILRDLLSLNNNITVLCIDIETEVQAKTIGAKNIIKNYDRKLSFDGIVVATPSETHYQVIKDCLDYYSETPIFCEKTLTTDVNQALDLQKNGSDQIFVMDKWRYHPGIIKLAEIVQSREFGRLRGIRTVRNSTCHMYPNTDPVWILLTHNISICYTILGYFPEFESALANRYDERIMSLQAISKSDPWIYTEISTTALKAERATLLYFDDYILALDDSDYTQIKVNKFSEDKNNLHQQTSIQLSKEMPLLEELREFVNYLQGGVAPRSNCAYGVKMVEEIEKLRLLSNVK